MGPIVFLFTHEPAVVEERLVAEFPVNGDRGSFKVYEVVVAPSFSFELNPAGGGGFLSIFDSRPTGSRGLATTDLNFRMRTRGQKVTSAEVLAKQPCLFLLVRLHDPAGEPVSSDVFVDPIDPNQVKSVVRGAFGEFRSIESIPAGTRELPAYEVAVEDGAGGWLTMRGPSVFQEEDGRAILVAHSFPRGQSDLRFRISIDGSPAGEFMASNPSYTGGSPPDPWTADPLTWEEDLGDVTVYVEKITDQERPGRKTLPYVTFGHRPTGEQLPEAFRLRYAGVSDAMGNRASHGSFDPLPGTRQLRYHGTIEQSHRFRWPRYEVSLIAKGLKQAGKNTISFEPVGAGKRYGFISVTMKRQVPTAHEGSQKWQLTLAGNAIKSSIGSPVFDRNYR